MEKNNKNYCIAFIFKNGMKITSKPTTKRKAKEKYANLCLEFTSNIHSHIELENTIFKIEDIFMIMLYNKQEEKNQ